MQESIFTLFLTADHQANQSTIQHIATYFDLPLVVVEEEDLTTESRFYRRIVAALQGYEPAPRQEQRLLWASAREEMRRRRATSLVLFLRFPDTQRRLPKWLVGFLYDCINQKWLVLLALRENLGRTLERDPMIGIYVDQEYSLAEGAETLQEKIAGEMKLLGRLGDKSEN